MHTFFLILTVSFFSQGLTHQMGHLFNNLLLSPLTPRGLADLEKYRSQMAAAQGSNESADADKSSENEHPPSVDDDVFNEASELSAGWIQTKEPEE